VLRDTTERPEGVHAGTVRLVGTSFESIVSSASRLLGDREEYRRMSDAVNPYGDGQACKRILEALLFLSGRGASPEPFRALKAGTARPSGAQSGS
jgi:UDP-N-acetylglucosamine 2-epimerase (non-hydrolysing)